MKTLRKYLAKVGIGLVAILVIGLFVLPVLGFDSEDARHFFGLPPAYSSSPYARDVAQAQAGTADPAPSSPQPSSAVINLQPDAKLESAGWHCYAGGGCELWYLTRPMRASEKPEKHEFRNYDGTREYLFIESVSSR